jgi:hypothetical protein
MAVSERGGVEVICFTQAPRHPGTQGTQAPRHPGTQAPRNPGKGRRCTVVRTEETVLRVRQMMVIKKGHEEGARWGGGGTEETQRGGAGVYLVIVPSAHRGRDHRATCHWGDEALEHRRLKESA